MNHPDKYEGNPSDNQGGVVCPINSNEDKLLKIEQHNMSHDNIRMYVLTLK